jgi:hypothetical protein
VTPEGMSKGHWWMVLTGKAELLGEESVPMPLCSQKNPTGGTDISPSDAVLLHDSDNDLS